MLGKSDGDRMVFLGYEQKANGVVRGYSAREMTDKERRGHTAKTHDEHRRLGCTAGRGLGGKWATLPEAAIWWGTTRRYGTRSSGQIPVLGSAKRGNRPDQASSGPALR
ncbi:MAG: hypothetical protein M0Z42_09750 [Actinomycetota bacterium]|jgi:hypothetical protein|nr:hypothetical protein [Actinomycetota bacterium]